MKILISTMPAVGHINLTQSMVLELVKRGHEVRWLTGPAFKSDVEVTGATFVAFNSACLAAIEYPLSSGAQADHESSLSAAVSFLISLFVSPIPPIVAQYQEIFKSFNADIIVSDFGSLPAYVWRELGGPVNVSLSVNPLATMDPEIPIWGSSAWPATTMFGRWMNTFQHWISDVLVMRKVNAALNAEREKLGLKEPLTGEEAYPRCSQSRYLHIMPTTAMFEFPRKGLRKEVRFVGPLKPIVRRDWERPTWWEEVISAHANRTGDGERKKVVHVTQGTFVTASSNLIKPTIRALAKEEDILLVVTTKDADAMAREINIPENVRMATFVPHQELLKHVDTMVTNGGYGAVLTALSMGIPLVGAGLTEDKAMVNARIAWSGAGVDLKTNTPTEAQIKWAVRKVLDDEKYGGRAREIQEDFAKHPGPKNACDALEELLTSL